MDYINFGIGTGATLALFGWLFRDWGPRLRDHAPLPDEVLSARELVSRMAWKRFCHSCGMALTIGGLLVVLATVGVAFWNPDDSLGFDVVLGIYGAIIVLLMVWAGMFLRQFGAVGIIRPRVKTSLATRPEKTAEVAVAPVQTPSTESPSPADEPGKDASFDDVAAARGGLGRFAAFFKREDATEEPVHDLGAEDPATDAVIAALGASDADSDDKRLSISDPLVVRVAGWIDPEREVEVPDAPEPEAELAATSEAEPDENLAASEEPESAALSEREVEEEAPVYNVHTSTEPETPEDEALLALRKRRLARLSGTSDDQS